MQDNHFLCTTLLFDLRQWPYLSNNHHSLFTIQYIYNMYCPWQRNDTLLGAPFCVRIEGMSVILFNHQSCSLTCCWLNFTWNLWTEFYSNFVYKSHLAWIMEFEEKKSGPFQQTYDGYWLVSIIYVVASVDGTAYWLVVCWNDEYGALWGQQSMAALKNGHRVQEAKRVGQEAG